jgi:hypothetical protein
MLPPPPQWRPAQVVQGPPPRPLPHQNHGRIDDEEARARRVTQIVAGVAGAALLLLMCWVCGAAVF